ncbi:hypothetical protein DCAR_0415119 [Daucus carota subsp. sativus]|uniref:Uncharacterized protein n=1 Tax=Daucus carota subsp. sativus TaxID=79200 RepID=A0A165A766_DAUCS|nr:hypothetical protein DCAR_0415119 [Daucus carota subsp. sativus]
MESDHRCIGGALKADSGQELQKLINNIDNLVRGKTLPQKGKLSRSVLDAGPLLETLLVAGPVPKWRNPPPLDTLSIPPFTGKGGYVKNFN